MCDAQRVELTFDGGSPQEAAYGTSRGDTRRTCGDTDNGFGLLFNWNLLGDGSHHVVAYADGVEFARVDVTVTTLGTEFRRGLRGREIVTDFPEVGTDTRLRWQEAQQNFVITAALPTLRLVAVDPYILLPNDIRIPNITVSSFLSETAEVRASPKPTLLLAEDAGGTVLLALANMDGGGGRGPGSVAVDLDSTAMTLVGLTAGISVSDMTPSILDVIFYHQQYPALVADLTRRLRADTNFLDRLYDEPATVRLLQAVAEPLTIAAIPQAVGATFETTTPASMAESRCEVTKDLLQSEAALDLIGYMGIPVEGIKRVHRIATKTIETVGEYERCKQNFPNVWRSSIYPPPHPQPPYDEKDIAGAWYADQYKIRLALACTVNQLGAVGIWLEEVATEVGQAGLEFVSGKLLKLASGGKDWLVDLLVDGYNRRRGPEVVEELVDVAQESGCDITAEDITGEEENAPPEEDITGEEENAPPEFEEASYTFTLSENRDGTRGGVAVGTVKARPGGQYAITYSIQSGGYGEMRVDPEAGVVRYIGNGADYETSHIRPYHITVRATESGGAGLSTDVEVTVEIQDEDEPPYFREETYEFTNKVTHPTFVGRIPIGTVQAQDPEKTEVHHSLLSGDAARFSVSSDGRVTYCCYNDPLPGGEATHRLIVRATDSGGAGLSTDIQVNVRLVGDAPPEFTQAVYSFTLRENVAGPVAVGTVVARAQDAGGTVKYSLSTGDRTRFTVGSTTGVVSYIGAGENSDQQASFTLVVVATDAAGRTASARVQIAVEAEGGEWCLFKQEILPAYWNSPDTNYNYRASIGCYTLPLLLRDAPGSQIDTCEEGTSWLSGQWADRTISHLGAYTTCGGCLEAAPRPGVDENPEVPCLD